MSRVQGCFGTLFSAKRWNQPTPLVAVPRNFDQTEIPGDFLDDVGLDGFLVQGIRRHQGVFADAVDQPRHPAGILVDQLQRLGWENWRAAVAGDSQAVLEVLLGLLRRQRGERALEGDALLELSVFGFRQFFVQLGLAGNHDLDQLFSSDSRFEIRPQALDRLGGEVLRLVQHDDHVATRRHLRMAKWFSRRTRLILVNFFPGL